MANDVFANGREVSCKAADGKSICAFPDVCMTPPENPATPPGVPVPYPNTGFARDTTEGSRTVRISGEEIILKNKSHFKQSTGDEAGCAAKKGVVTSTNRGKVYFTAWSMDVKIEGENAARHLDPTTHNHASPLPNEGVPMVYIDTMAFGTLAECAGDKEKMEKACDGQDPCPGVLKHPVGEQREQVSRSPSKRGADFKGHADVIADGGDSRTAKAAAAATAEAEASDCVKASRCHLRPYRPNAGQGGCCPGQTPHHVPPKAGFKTASGGYQVGYDPDKALCVCLEGASQHLGSHGKNHAAIEWLAKQKGIKPGQSCGVKDYNALCAATVEAQCGCDKGCIEAQLNADFEKKKVKTVKHTNTNSSAGVTPEMENSIRESAGLPANATSGR